ncbi:MAG: LysM domain-containing protein [Bdellovibrionota bacterium]
MRFSILVTAAAISLLSFPALSQEDPAAPTTPVPPAGQEMPASRPKYDIELNKESSSFVPDPDSLDPLPLKKESLKEDDEPVLDDIKSILKIKAVKKPKTGAAKSNDVTSSAPVKKAKKKTARKAKKTAPVVDATNLSPDDPDLALEQKFNDIYNKYNINPTSEEVWGMASSKAANVYDVQKGDTLFTISRTLFADPQFWPKIWALNNGGITNPHNIAPGTKIYFYPGDGGQAPSMSLGGEAPGKVALVDSDGVKPRDTTTKQNTEFNRLVTEGVAGKIDVQNIPPSFPPYSGVKYFSKAKSTEILITPVPEVKDRAPENPFILTSTLITTEYKVMEKNANSLVCKDNQYVPAVMKIGKNAKPGRYSMLVQESFNFGQLKRTYIYRIIGEADVGSDESLRISQCIKPVNTDVLLVNSEDLEDVKPPNELIPNTRSQIIEGVEVNAQQYYYAHQYVILNMSQLPALEGADLKVYSASAGGVVGEIRILKRTGTMAIGYVMKNDDLVQLGDRVIIPE